MYYIKIVAEKDVIDSKRKHEQLEKTIISDMIGSYKTTQSMAREDYLHAKYFKHNPIAFNRILFLGVIYGISVFFRTVSKFPIMLYMVYRIDQGDDPIPLIV
jgi:hypothetical protein